MLKALESGLANKTFTADALLTQTKLADFLIGRGAHYLFAVKGNRPNLLTRANSKSAHAPACGAGFREDT